jgi:hypothetical protein
MFDAPKSQKRQRPYGPDRVRVTASTMRSTGAADHDSSSIPTSPLPPPDGHDVPALDRAFESPPSAMLAAAADLGDQDGRHHKLAPPPQVSMCHRSNHTVAPLTARRLGRAIGPAPRQPPEGDWERECPAATHARPLANIVVWWRQGEGGVRARLGMPAASVFPPSPVGAMRRGLLEIKAYKITRVGSYRLGEFYFLAFART